MDCDVAIIGAGPYGLSVAAHLRAIAGLEVRVFGEPMSFWKTHMPVGMLLRSPWAGSHLSDPECSLTLDAFRDRAGKAFGAPIPLGDFIDYGLWFKEQVAPDVDRRQVVLIEPDRPGFALTLDDGTKLNAQRVVIATGIGAFVWRPELFRELPASLSSHTSEHRDLGIFAGKRVAVIGAGQSALESAALLHEAGAEVELLVRAPLVRFLWPRPLLHKWPLKQLLYAPPDVGPAFYSHIIARPDIYKLMTRQWQDRMGRRAIRAAGAGWLKPRLETVKIACDSIVERAEPRGERLMLTLSGGKERVVDHALLGTGYKVDIGKHTFLDPRLLAAISEINGYPKLNGSFESSVPGLYFVGAPAAWSFGPLMRFVAGAGYTSLRLANGIARERRGTRPVQRRAVPPAEPVPGISAGENRREVPAAEVKVIREDSAPSRPQGVLLTGTDYRALGAARSLGRHGVPVCALRRPDQPIAAFSRYIQRTFAFAKCNSQCILEFLQSLAAEHGLNGWLLLPTDDEMVGLIARNYEQLAGSYKIGIPPWEQLRQACDKRLLYGVAKRLELDQPATYFPKTRADVAALECSFPVIIKPSLHESFDPCLCSILQLSGRGGFSPDQRDFLKRLAFDKAWQIEDKYGLFEVYDRFCAIVPPELIMIQEVVPGGGDTQFSHAALCSGGEVLAAVTARRVRQYPMDFGRFSTYVETVEEPAVVGAAEKLLRALDYTGLAEVEFKQDSRDGRFRLLDVNTRIWGWHTLGSIAGADFPYLQWLLMSGERITEAQGRSGAGWMRLTADLPVAAREILGGRLPVRDYLESFKKPLESAIYASDDPLPGLLEVPLLLYSRFRRLMASKAG